MPSRAHALLHQLNDSRLWLGRELAATPAHATGFAALDAVLPGRGWPLGGLNELIARTAGIGELSLLLPVLTRLSEHRQIVLINPPYIPYAPALVRQRLTLNHVLWLADLSAGDALWAATQLAGSGTAGAILLWTHQPGEHEMRRLQLAVETRQGLCFVYRPPVALRNASLAAVRLALDAAPGGRLRIDVIKAKGGRAGAQVIIAPSSPDALADLPARHCA